MENIIHYFGNNIMTEEYTNKSIDKINEIIKPPEIGEFNLGCINNVWIELCDIRKDMDEIKELIKFRNKRKVLEQSSEEDDNIEQQQPLKKQKLSTDSHKYENNNKSFVITNIMHEGAKGVNVSHGPVVFYSGPQPPTSLEQESFNKILNNEY